MAQVSAIAMYPQIGEIVEKGQEFGYFTFGGSDIITLFSRNDINFDFDEVPSFPPAFRQGEKFAELVSDQQHEPGPDCVDTFGDETPGFLGAYACSTTASNFFIYSLGAAELLCCQCDECGGVTLEPHRFIQRYTLRMGSFALPSPTGESSWIKA
eukprot:TRINITY_DN1030_c0_g1_i2.p1 TRINITY_DN1030_c0_g1~~TRINITY_DN1030_c0_g1_i2.p1  ORF type:complete len:155 (-),score=21.64 TRINITY_DN1030_c0_g1_i2:195-659(-)